ncbi:hypothetical protein CHUAL_012355 [Chamberlinius hualienensis]
MTTVVESEFKEKENTEKEEEVDDAMTNMTITTTADEIDGEENGECSGGGDSSCGDGEERLSGECTSTNKLDDMHHLSANMAASETLENDQVIDSTLSTIEDVTDKMEEEVTQEIPKTDIELVEKNDTEMKIEEKVEEPIAQDTEITNAEVNNVDTHPPDNNDSVISPVPPVKAKSKRRKPPPPRRSPQNKSILRPALKSQAKRYQSPPRASDARVTESISPHSVTFAEPLRQFSDNSDSAKSKLKSSQTPLSQSNGVLDQIKQSVLPPYRSFVSPTLSGLNGYGCPDCGDHFWLESSFAHHVQRRSVYISFFCHVCNKLLTFYNRCSLLGHARIHRERQQQTCDISTAALAPLEKDLIPCIQEAKMAPALNPSENKPPPTKRKHKDGSTSSSASPVVTIIIPETEANAIYTTTNKNAGHSNHTNGTSHSAISCIECKQNCRDYNELAEHFGESRKAPPTTDSECPQCHMICASRCSLVSHRRMHAKDRPYVCPECGKTISDVWQEFKNHVTDVCLHHSRTLGFRCPSCGILSVNPEQLKTHVSAEHVVVLYKCQRCPSAFKSGKTFEHHRKTAHGGATDENSSKTNYSTIHRCPLCESVYHQQHLLIKHLDSHFQEIFAAANYVFRCLECGYLSETKNGLDEHLKSTHNTSSVDKRHNKPAKKKQKIDNDHVIDKTPSKTEVNTSSTINECTVICEHCNREFRSVLGLNVHRFRGHGIRTSQVTDTDHEDVEKPPIMLKIKKKKEELCVVDEFTSASLKCKLCYDEFFDIKALSEHGQLHIQEGFLVCMLCSNMTFTNKIALSKHLEKHSTLATYPSSCMLCKQVMENRTQAAVHWREEHGLSSYQCPHCETRYLYHKSLSRHIREVHKGIQRKPSKNSSVKVPQTQIKHLQELKALEMAGSESALPNEEPELDSSVMDVDVKEDTEKYEDIKDVKNGEYVCAKCNFQCINRNLFQLHIQKHKSGEGGDSFQCLECGICFVVEPSLHKHLKLVHKIKDLDAYFQGMTTYSGADGLLIAANNRSGGKISNGGHVNYEMPTEFRCTVCYLHFENEQLLKTHSRSHGMAFLQSRKRTSLGSPSDSLSSPSSTPTKCQQK